MMGNRGVLHNDDRTLLRQAQLRRWIACRLEFRGRRRVVMTPRRYTELFFLDEAVAFSAGHRPCAECRNSDYKRFLSLWRQRFGGIITAESMDKELQHGRLYQGAKRTYCEDIGALPEGTYVVIDGAAWLIWNRELLRWTDAGYQDRRVRPASGEVEILTPKCVVDVFRTGYVPEVHPSANR